CGVFSASSLSALRSRYQRPSRPIPIGTISYRAGSIADITVSAERSEISCSLERPPNRTPTLSRFFSAIERGGSCFCVILSEAKNPGAALDTAQSPELQPLPIDSTTAG